VARRRYRSDATSTAGLSARGRDLSGDESLSLPIEPKQEYGKAEPAAQPQATSEPAQPISGLGQQLHDMRQQAEQAQLHGYIDSIPNLSPAQRHWLHSNPHGVYRFDLLNDAHMIAGHRNIPVDSPEYFHFLSAMLNTYGPLPPQQPAQAQPAPSPPPMPPPVVPPMHVDVSKTENADTGEPEAASVAAHFMSAPVSRGEAGHSIEPELSPSQVRLSKAEREHAEAAGVSLEEYGRQKLKMLKLKKAKVIKDE
jgi:hypothetical protein